MKILTNATRAILLVSAAACFGCSDDTTTSPTPDSGGGDSGVSDAGTAVTYNVTLTKAQELTACPGAGVDAAGTAKVTVSADNKTITVTDVTYVGLSGAAVAAHIHANKAGSDGKVVLAFTTITSPFSKTFTEADYKVVDGAPADFAAFVTSLKAGGAYINVHTTACQAGEIRGQIQ